MFDEILHGTEPGNPDTNGDGVLDGSSDAECFPLDAARTGACAGSVPGDTTPPTITLTKPAATLVSSVP